MFDLRKALSRAALLLVATLFPNTPALGQEEPAPIAVTEIDFENLTPREAARLFSEDQSRWLDEPCDFGVPIVNIVQKARPDAVPVRQLLLKAQIFCADERGEYQDGIAMTRAYNVKYPDDLQMWLLLYFSRRTEDVDLAIEVLSSLEGEGFQVLTKESYGAANRLIHLAGRSEELDAIALNWFDKGQVGFIDTEFHETFARRALAAALRDSRTELVPRMLGYMTSPLVYVGLLTEREFEPIWPQIEERVGRNLESVGIQDVEIAINRLAIGATNRDRFSDAAHALHFHGDFAQAIDLAERWRAREDRGLEFEEGDGWALNIQAFAYDSLGEIEKADDVFDQLAAIDPDENYWVVSFVINRASRLVGQGRWKEGLEAAKLAREVAEDYGTPFAKMIIARDHACALTQLNRIDEAEDELVFLRENAAESVNLVSQALLCLGLKEEAAQVLIDGLNDPATKDSALRALAKPETELFYTSSMLPKARSLMREYPELRSGFYAAARDLPEAFVPRASILRAKLELPKWD